MQISKKTWLISLSAAVAMGAFACGDETDDPSPAVDSGVGDSGVRADASTAACTTINGITGASCVPPGGGVGYQTCNNGVPSGPCNALNIGSLTDGGGLSGVDAAAFFGDGGLPGILGDGGLPDGAVNSLPACPAMFNCGGMGSFAGSLITSAVQGQAAGASYCAKNGDAIGLPPMCAATADCAAAGLTTANCTMIPMLGSYCVQACKQ